MSEGDGRMEDHKLTAQVESRALTSLASTPRGEDVTKSAADTDSTLPQPVLSEQGHESDDSEDENNAKEKEGNAEDDGNLSDNNATDKKVDQGTQPLTPEECPLEEIEEGAVGSVGHSIASQFGHKHEEDDSIALGKISPSPTEKKTCTFEDEDGAVGGTPLKGKENSKDCRDLGNNFKRRKPQQCKTTNQKQQGRVATQDMPVTSTDSTAQVVKPDEPPSPSVRIHSVDNLQLLVSPSKETVLTPQTSLSCEQPSPDHQTETHTKSVLKAACDELQNAQVTEPKTRDELQNVKDTKPKTSDGLQIAQDTKPKTSNELQNAPDIEPNTTSDELQNVQDTKPTATRDKLQNAPNTEPKASDELQSAPNPALETTAKATSDERQNAPDPEVETMPKATSDELQNVPDIASKGTSDDPDPAPETTPKATSDQAQNNEFQLDLVLDSEPNTTRQIICRRNIRRRLFRCMLNGYIFHRFLESAARNDALLYSYRAWYDIATGGQEWACRVLQALGETVRGVPFARLGIYRISSLLALLEEDFDRLSTIITSSIQLLTPPFPAGIACLAGWVFLHKGLAPGPYRLHWLRRASEMFQEDGEELGYGRDITNYCLYKLGQVEQHIQIPFPDSVFTKFYLNLVAKYL